MLDEKSVEIYKDEEWADEVNRKMSECEKVRVCCARLFSLNFLLVCDLNDRESSVAVFSYPFGFSLLALLHVSRVLNGKFDRREVLITVIDYCHRLGEGRVG